MLTHSNDRSISWKELMVEVDNFYADPFDEIPVSS